MDITGTQRPRTPAQRTTLLPDVTAGGESFLSPPGVGLGVEGLMSATGGGQIMLSRGIFGPDSTG